MSSINNKLQILWAFNFFLLVQILQLNIQSMQRKRNKQNFI